MFDPDEMLMELEERMMKTEEALKQNFNGIRTGKASPALVENLMVEYYGCNTRLKELAGISAPEPRLLVIQPWDASAVAAVEKAILASNLGITPMSDGKTLKLPIPELSQDRRQALAKQALAKSQATHSTNVPNSSTICKAESANTTLLAGKSYPLESILSTARKW